MPVGCVFGVYLVWGLLGIVQDVAIQHQVRGLGIHVCGLGLFPAKACVFFQEMMLDVAALFLDVLGRGSAFFAPLFFYLAKYIALEE